MYSNPALKIAIFLLFFDVQQALSKNYYLHLNKLNWHGAFEACALHNLQLATVNSQSEQDDMEKVVKDAGKQGDNIWIGGSDLAQHNSYTWIASGKPLSYGHWTPGEPSVGGHEHCIHLWPVPNSTISWNNRPCHLKYYYICEDARLDDQSKKVNINFTVN